MKNVEIIILNTIFILKQNYILFVCYQGVQDLFRIKIIIKTKLFLLILGTLSD